MRVCRFGFDEMVLTGFYADDQVIPIDQAAEAYSRDMGVELLLPSTEDLLDLLPPDGISYEAARELFAWIEQLDADVARRADDPDRRTSGCWCRSPTRPRCCFLAGNYAKHVAERGGTAAERAGDVSLRLHEAAEHHADPPRRPDRDPRGLARPDRLGVRAGRRDRPPLPARRRGRGDGLHRRLHDRQRHQRPRRSSPTPAASRASATSSSTGCTASGTTRSARWARASCRPTWFPTRRRSPSSSRSTARSSKTPRRPRWSSRWRRSSRSLSEFVTLQPGDVIATGTPSGVGSATGTFLRPGDLVGATIGPIGTLENPVEAEDDETLNVRMVTCEHRSVLDRTSRTRRAASIT